MQNAYQDFIFVNLLTKSKLLPIIGKTETLSILNNLLRILENSNIAKPQIAEKMLLMVKYFF